MSSSLFCFALSINVREALRKSIQVTQEHEYGLLKRKLPLSVLIAHVLIAMYDFETFGITPQRVVKELK